MFFLGLGVGAIAQVVVLIRRQMARERPLSEADVRHKYDLNARALGSGADTLAERIAGVGELGDVRDLLSG